ncbi:hypothetical protein HaLaN_26053, partial [Haematococcus lacustris]
SIDTEKVRQAAAGAANQASSAVYKAVAAVCGGSATVEAAAYACASAVATATATAYITSTVTVTSSSEQQCMVAPHRP